MSQKIQKIAKNSSLQTVKIKTEFNRLGTLKTIIILSLILFQFLVLLFSYFYLFLIFKWFTLFSVIATLITCIHCLSTEKNGQSKGTWIFLMLICFTFGYIIYFFSNEKILFSRAKSRYKKIYKSSSTFLPVEKTPTNLPAATFLDCEYLLKAGNFPAFNSSRTQYFPSGYQFFEDALKFIKRAKKFVFMEFFIISNGVVLNRLLNVLEQKVKNGVDVRIIYDDLGSHGTLSKHMKKKIRKAGIKLQAFNKFVPIFNISLYFRDHRKIIVVDGEVGYTGGTNLADEYVNEKRMHGYWKDCGIRICGPAVNTLTLAFLRQWEFLTKQTPNYASFLTNSNNRPQSSTLVVPFVDGPDYNESIGRNAYINLISKAEQKIYIMTPYFIPDETIIDLLKTKARAGLDVKIILPEIADKKFVYHVTRNNAERLLDYGVKIFVMKHSFVHSKLCLTDKACIVGSINFDQRSFYHQFESAVYLNDKNTMQDVLNDINKTIEYSTLITTQNQKRNNFANRVITGFLRIISPFM